MRKLASVSSCSTIVNHTKAALQYFTPLFFSLVQQLRTCVMQIDDYIYNAANSLYCLEAKF